MRHDFRAICDQCASEWKLSQLRKRFDGAMCCPYCWETRHPQEFIRPRKEAKPPRDTRPQPADVFIADWEPDGVNPACPTGSWQAIAGVAVAGCAVAGAVGTSYWATPIPAPTVPELSL